ncbi:phosphoglyceromutase [Hyphomonas sp. L-53-1-40]|uniref:2,3-diphosphoglycerate-dependent phosphoglycerate mutase n=1 Tax=Hyphomonas sp. L-53-1-40 TaxID=1207058 RepID=UPI00045912DD|nr:2,3-diphosphoglycerate-dependent phosphoglycerate mutase [Hyphomonas sp. L-53-1-40]KCZ61910.1 phosphoglyceromutase [Hyphomonas sp. L-53-1-40]
MPRLALVRHGQSEWNLQNRFTGWWDADLTEKGEAEAKKSGEMLKTCDADFRAAFTSVQTRAIRTLWIALTEMDRVWMPVTKHWRLNERHYGGLTGLNKAETAAKHGEDQVHIWRRSYDIPPPPMESGSEFDLAGDPRYKGIDIPNTESLKLTLERVLPYWEEAITPVLKSGTDVVIAAHGNSLRALVKHLFQVPDESITGIEIPTGNPLYIDLDDTLKPVSVRYLDADRSKPLPELP